MLKVLICDDEGKVCKLIKNLIEWDELGLSLCGIAYTGQKALEIIESRRPDIVVTDIRMPDLDGLELVKRVRELNPDTQFIIISGYQYFEYAQTALRFGISDYLLKPINKEELNSALSVVSERISHRQKYQMDQEQIRATLDHSLVKLEEYQVNAILFQEPLISLDALTSENANLRFSGNTFNVCALAFDAPVPECNVTPGIASAIAKTMSYIRSSTAEFFTDLLCAHTDNYIYCVINYQESLGSAVKLFFDQLLYNARKFSDAFEGTSVTIGIGTPVRSYENIKASVRTALDAIHSRISYGINRIIYYSHFSPEGIQEFHLHSQEIQTLGRITDSLNSSEYSAFLKELFERASDGSAPFLLYYLSEEIFSAFLQHLFNSRYIRLDTRQLQRQFQRRLQFIWNKKQLIQLLTDFFDEYVQSVQAKNDTEMDYPIRQAVSYVEKHYMEDCSLTAAADFAHLSPTYFSTFFKQKMGVNFHSYVARYRMEIAKQHLRDSDKTIQEIASLLTYSNPKHFRHLFKKYVGISPAQFRDLYR